jgi:plasmid maintenance system antidote protein VapI
MVKKRDLPENKLLDTIKRELDIHNDAHLARLLKAPPSAISKIRYGTSTITAEFILKVYDATGWSIEDIRSLLPYANTRKQSEVFSYEDT